MMITCPSCKQPVEVSNHRREAWHVVDDHFYNQTSLARNDGGGLVEVTAKCIGSGAKVVVL